MATVRISGHWRTINKLEYAGSPNMDPNGHIERSVSIPEEAYRAMEGHLLNGVKEGSIYLPDGRRFDWFLDGQLPAKPASASPSPSPLPSSAVPTSPFFALDTTKMPWEERFSAQIGKAIFRKELFSEPETGMLVRLVRYPAGVINPSHTHPCGHGMYVLEGQLVTHKGTFGPGHFVWFPEGEVMEHGASAAGDVVAVFITNKPFRIDYLGAGERK